MAKKSRKGQIEEDAPIKKANSAVSQPSIVQEDAVDPSLALLFASSAGPTKAPLKSRYGDPAPATVKHARKVEIQPDITSEIGDDEELSSVDGDPEDGNSVHSSENVVSSSQTLKGEDPLIGSSLDDLENKPRKRKRKNAADDIEGRYMLRLAREEEKEESERRAERQAKRQRLEGQEDGRLHEESLTKESDEDKEKDDKGQVDNEDALSDIPLHETLAPDKNTTELEKASRTVFLANVSTSAITDKKAKKILVDHMASFLDDLQPPKDGKVHKVESIRFRSTAYEVSLPKKAAYATKALMGATTKSTNAYVVYSTAFAAREAAKRLNGSVVLDRHLRVDGVAHPAKTDHRRCVFVGNLGFVDDESMVQDGGENERKRSKIPSDIEEGLWRQFGKAGEVESVRVVRDEKTRVGKGIAYVQFKDANAVEAALLYNEKKYPPMLPRVLRVTRAKALKKTALASQRARTAQRPQPGGSSNPNNAPIYNPKITSQVQSLQGRANKLLGRAGAAQLRKGEREEFRGNPPPAGMNGILKTPESIVFEGFRASSKAGRPKDLKFGKGQSKKNGKPKTRSSKRGADWKNGGGKKAK